MGDDQQVDLSYFLDRLLEMHNAQLQELRNYRQHAEATQEHLLSLRDRAQSPNEPAEVTQEHLLSLRDRAQSPNDDASTILSVSHPSRRITIKPKEYNGSPDENVATWLSVFEESMDNRRISAHDRMGIAIELLGGTALQWFVNLKAKQQRPASWTDFKQQLLKHFQPANNQELLRQQLFRLRQDRSVHEYIQSFRVLTGQIEGMDELTQVMLFVNGLTNNYGMYVRSKHPKTVNDAILEATTFETFLAANPSNSVRFPSLFDSPNVEFNAINSRLVSRSPHQNTTASSVSKEDCFKLGLCFYCKAPGHRALRCPKKPRSSQTATHQKNDQW